MAGYHGIKGLLSTSIKSPCRKYNIDYKSPCRKYRLWVINTLEHDKQGHYSFRQYVSQCGPQPV